MTPNEPNENGHAGPDEASSDEAARLLSEGIGEDLSTDSAGSRRVRARMWQKIEASLREAHAGYVTIRAEEGVWVPLFPLVEIKLLHSAGKGASFLLKLQPGAHLPPHDHLAAEECLMLEGELDLGDGVTIRAGDYHLAPAALRHGIAVSRKGALIFVRSDEPAYQL